METQENINSEYSEKQLALAKFLGITPDEINETRYDTFEVNPTKRKLGTGPNEILENVRITKEALKRAFSKDEWNKNIERWASLDNDLPVYWERPSHQFTERDYRFISQKINENCPEVLKIGIHTVLNTLFFLSSAFDSGTEPYRIMLKDAWDNKPITDTREYSDVSDGEYMVLTDEEADEKWSESMDSYIDDCLEIPENLEPYFDREKWKKDAQMDGRGHSLSSYDGEENECDGFYIYRTN